MTARLEAKIDANQGKMMAKIEAHHERMTARTDSQLEKMVATDLEANQKGLWRCMMKSLRKRPQ
jgi:hypothetical protein